MRMLTSFLAGLTCLAFATGPVTAAEKRAAAHAKESATLSATMMNLEYEGTKIWLPGTLTVRKGTKVTLKLINNAPSGQHGFAIPEFNVAEVVDKGEPKTVEFTATKTGIFPIICQLHPAHVGGQLVVLP